MKPVSSTGNSPDVLSLGGQVAPGGAAAPTAAEPEAFFAPTALVVSAQATAAGVTRVQGMRGNAMVSPQEFISTRRAMPAISANKQVWIPRLDTPIIGKAWYGLENRFPVLQPKLVAAWGNVLTFGPSALSFLATGFSAYELVTKWSKLSTPAKVVNTSATALSAVGSGAMGMAAYASWMGRTSPWGSYLAGPCMGLAGSLWTGIAAVRTLRDPSKSFIQKAVAVSSAGLMVAGTALAFFPGAQMLSAGLMVGSGAIGMVGGWINRWYYGPTATSWRETVVNALATALEATSFGLARAKKKEAASQVKTANKLLLQTFGPPKS
ncbi:MAG: hypothetical protein JWM80_4718 [Cyanobacteria bacterium RYN_339]|nr:hypothetical protein [Cyanobacteria bacterium RYN_339]